MVCSQNIKLLFHVVELWMYKAHNSLFFCTNLFEPEISKKIKSKCNMNIVILKRDIARRYWAYLSVSVIHAPKLNQICLRTFLKLRITFYSKKTHFFGKKSDFLKKKVIFWPITMIFDQNFKIDQKSWKIEKNGFFQKMVCELLLRC